MMDWAIVSESTFFLGITLLAIVVTIFVFASSLLGRAIEAHRDDQEKLNKEKEELLTRRKEDLQSKLQKSVTAEDISQLKKEIEKLEAEIANIKNKSENIKKSYEVFEVKGGVFYPALCFLSSSILSGLAWSLSKSWMGYNLGSFFIPYGPMFWLLALLALGFGIWRLYLSLTKIQEVAVTSEEAALRRTVQAFKTAQTETEEKSRPKLKLTFEGDQPPFSVKATSTLSLKFNIGLAQGVVARKPELLVLVPEGFIFLESNCSHTKYTQSSKFRYPNYVGIYLNLKEDCKLGVNYIVDLKLQAPSQKSNFKLAYRLLCESFAGEYQEFKVVVQ